MLILKTIIIIKLNFSNKIKSINWNQIMIMNLMMNIKKKMNRYMEYKIKEQKIL